MAEDNSPQELAFKNRFVRYLTQTNDILPDNQETTIYSPNTLGVFVKYSQEDWLRVYSAILTGADLLYPAEAHEVAYLFTQWWDNYMAICDQIAECIANSVAVQAALNQWYEQQAQPSVGGGGTLLPTSTLTENLLPTGWECTDAKAYGMADAIVRFFDSEFTSLLAQIEVATNRVEAIALVVDNNQVTAIGGTAIEFAAWMQDTLTEIYDAANSESTLIALICDLYCLIKQDCTLSLDSLTEWAGRNATVQPTVTNLLEIMTAMTVFYGAGLPAREVVAGAFWMLIQFQRLQALSPISLGLLAIEDIIILSQDEESNDYLVCDACPEPIAPYCYAVSDAEAFGVTINTSRGLFGLGGVLVGDAGTGSTAIRIDATYNNAQSGTLSQIVVNYTATNLSPSDSALRLYVDDVLTDTVSLPASGAGLDITFTLADIPAGNIRLYFDTGRSTATLTISQVSFTGERAGGNPYPALECV